MNTNDYFKKLVAEAESLDVVREVEEVRGIGDVRKLVFYGDETFGEEECAVGYNYADEAVYVADFEADIEIRVGVTV